MKCNACRKRTCNVIEGGYVVRNKSRPVAWFCGPCWLAIARALGLPSSATRRGRQRVLQLELVSLATRAELDLVTSLTLRRLDFLEAVCLGGRWPAQLDSCSKQSA